MICVYNYTCISICIYCTIYVDDIHYYTCIYYCTRHFWRTRVDFPNPNRLSADCAALMSVWLTILSYIIQEFPRRDSKPKKRLQENRAIPCVCLL